LRIAQQLSPGGRSWFYLPSGDPTIIGSKGSNHGSISLLTCPNLSHSPYGTKEFSNLSQSPGGTDKFSSGKPQTKIPFLLGKPTFLSEIQQLYPFGRS